jgi:threonine dehydrogenase-like Zn-dependent dehydrogenase
MKAVQIVKPNQLEVIDIEKPVIDPKNNVLVKMTAAGICGSDVGIYHGTNAAATYPRIIGHEMVGVVAEVGDNVSSLKIGDRIIINQVTSCGRISTRPMRFNSIKASRTGVLDKDSVVESSFSLTAVPGCNSR